MSKIRRDINLLRRSVFSHKKTVTLGLLSLVVFFALMSVVFKTSATNQIANLDNIEVLHQQHSALFMKAVTDDLSGNPKAARKIYDQLKGSELSTQLAMPSAINWVALERFDEAGKAFTNIANAQVSMSSQYSRLWQQWLTARTWKGTPKGLRRKLSHQVINPIFTEPRYLAIAELYAGKGSIDAVFAAIENTSYNLPQAKGDALSEATFFAGGYLQYVEHNNKAALELYEREVKDLNSTSLERPLIEKTAALLSAAHYPQTLDSGMKPERE